MVNNFQKIIDEREAMLPPELEDRMSQHIGTFSVFGKVVELFVPNALQTVVRLIGGDELPCIKERKRGRIDPDWRIPPEPPTGPGGQ
ncbi:MAG: hypothetical protein WCR52_23440 [Bacteroidota bacterium]|jgi:hypothetical protein